ncbi:MAG: hypothetical protein L0271_25415 [Gemmatimonadetes bacterium]|nr:hypothetical protein [Gemmatimonadota bacterium]
MRKDIDAGVARIPALAEFGFVIHYSDGTLSLYAILGDERREIGRVDPFDLQAVAQALATRIMLDFTG